MPKRSSSRPTPLKSAHYNAGGHKRGCASSCQHGSTPAPRTRGQSPCANSVGSNRLRNILYAMAAERAVFEIELVFDLVIDSCRGWIRRGHRRTGAPDDYRRQPRRRSAAGADDGTDGEANRGEEAGRSDAPDHRARYRSGVCRRSQFRPDPAAGDHPIWAGKSAFPTILPAASRATCPPTTEQVGKNVRACLDAGGATVKNIVFTVNYVTRPAEFEKYADLRERYFGRPSPESATVPVPQLANPDLLVQIEAFAIK
jgi:Endoribonuclease L-PSP